MAEDLKKTVSNTPIADAPVEREYFFPSSGLNVRATSQEEAQIKHAELTKKETLK